MYRVVNDFLEDWKYESESTLKVFKNLTQESLEQKVTSDGRSLGKLAWHITLSTFELLTHAGLSTEQFDESAPVPENVQEILDQYEKNSQLVTKLVVENWRDENLAAELNMYGGVWKKGKVLAILIIHQAHHRAQMTVLMRQAGLKVPGIYGPSKEEWTVYGMPPQS